MKPFAVYLLLKYPKRTVKNFCEKFPQSWYTNKTHKERYPDDKFRFDSNFGH